MIVVDYMIAVAYTRTNAANIMELRDSRTYSTHIRSELTKSYSIAGMDLLTPLCIYMYLLTPLYALLLELA